MTRKQLLLLSTFSLSLTLLFFAPYCHGQDNNDYLQWSSTRKLTVDDFQIKTNKLETTSSFGQFYWKYHGSGFNFLKKNFNKDVCNYFVKSASWIDTTKNVKESLIYEQTLFDLSEIYIRQFRKELKENKGKFANGTDFVDELNSKISADFSKRRVDYDIATDYGANMTKQKEWEIQIQKELTELSDFAYDK